MSSPIVLTVNWSSSGGYSMTPANPNINTGGTARFMSPNKPSTVHFTPSTTPFGASVMVPMGGHVDVNVGAAEYSLQYSITGAMAGASMAATADAGAVKLMASTGTIKVGSG